MSFRISKRIIILIVTGLVLLSLAGALGSVGDSLRNNYQLECDAWGQYSPSPRFDPPDGPKDANETDEPEPLTDAQKQECRDLRRSVTLVDAVGRGAVGPGIAIIVISAVYLLGAALAALRRN